METNNEKRKGSSPVLRTVLSLIVLTAALALFAYWGFTEEELTVQGIIAAALSLLMFTFGVMLQIPQALRFFSGEVMGGAKPAGERSGKRGRKHPVFGVMLTILAVRLLIVIIAYIMARVFRHMPGSIFTTLREIWVKLDTDAPHYFSIAENWYVTEAPEMYNIVFLPLFPLFIRGLNFIFGDSFVSAMVLNTFCSCVAGAVIYELALCDMGRRSARNAVLFAMAFPAAIFFIAPMSEALFVLLCAVSLLAMRREKFWLAAVFGALASFTRSVGIILLVPFAAEAINYTVRKGKRGENAGVGKTVVKMIACALIMCLGTFAYLLINKLIWGEWFKFMQFQREIWYQEPSFFFRTAATQADQLFMTIGAEHDVSLGLWLPNLLYIFGALAVFVASARTLRTSYSLYFAVYFAITCGASWLLSAPRYLTALVVLPIALAHLCESRDDGIALARARAKTAVVTVILSIGQLLYLLMYVVDYSIY